MLTPCTPSAWYPGDAYESKNPNRSSTNKHNKKGSVDRERGRGSWRAARKRITKYNKRQMNNNVPLVSYRRQLNSLRDYDDVQALAQKQLGYLGEPLVVSDSIIDAVQVRIREMQRGRRLPSNKLRAAGQKAPWHHVVTGGKEGA
eukprot:3097928-Pleurochrysis_carterae.AAC.1